jgi:hypothetical protein
MKPEPYALRSCRPDISQLARIVRELCAVAGRWCLPLVAAVAVTVVVSPGQDALPGCHASRQVAMPVVVSGSDGGDPPAAVTATG